jgi:hypothetical protein
MFKNSISILASSSTVNGARNKSADGSYFEVYLNDATKIPDDAKNITVEVEKSTIWWTIPNFKSNNNQLYVTGQNVSNVVQSRLITVAPGLYDLSLLRTSILNELQNQGFKQTPLPVLDFAADIATGRVVIKMNYTNTKVDFRLANAPNSMNQILGYALAEYTTVTAPFNLVAPNVAQFNSINSLLIKSDLTDNGLSLNGYEDSIVSQVLINVNPGSQIIYEPNNPTRTSASNLQGRLLRNFHVELTDENRVRVDTFGENYSVLFKISWNA